MKRPHSLAARDEEEEAPATQRGLQLGQSPSATITRVNKRPASILSLSLGVEKQRVPPSLAGRR